MRKQPFRPCELKSLKLLNIGCGYNFHPAWINLDLVPCTQEVQRYDARRGLPFPDNVVDACYSSHVLEHLKKPEAMEFLQQQFRVLKSGGIIRVVVPDLEKITRSYLHELEQADLGTSEAQTNYDWMMLELLDQVARDVRGGQMGEYLQYLKDVENQNFVLSRVGTEIEYCENGFQMTLKQKLAGMSLSHLIQKARYEIAGLVVAIIAGKAAQKSFQEGIFRNAGEVHHWMYDRFSLKRLLQQTGFQDIKVCCPDESQIPDFNQYGLDVLEGKAKKPDSLFIEGVKPNLD
ncbi:MAG: methyltransferase domain-containing protein [Myxacorys chilensis ATA2-1-KO14]|nr:methyltransferase domain-containing protein [Myxacorys chilensis ATA2-1-KO14]